MDLMGTIEKALTDSGFADELKQAADACTLPYDPTKPDFDRAKWEVFLKKFSATPAELAKLPQKTSSQWEIMTTGMTTLTRLLKAAVTSTIACTLTTTTTTVQVCDHTRPKTAKRSR